MMLLDDSSAWNSAAGNWLVVAVPENPENSGQWSHMNDATGGQFVRMLESKDLGTGVGDLTTVFGPAGITAERLLLVGVGKLDELTRTRFEKAIMSAARKIGSKKDATASFAAVESIYQRLGTDLVGEITAQAVEVAGQGQDLRKAERGHFPLTSATFLAQGATEAGSLREALDRGTIIGEAINLTRELVNCPPQDMYPETFAARVRQVAESVGLAIEIMDEKQLEAERMGSLLAVARGSDRPPRMAILRHQGADADAPVLALVGKGVTFDSGGLSIKPTDGMLTMKCDMAGAATVLGAMQAIARLKLKINVTGYMPLVENMISGSSYKLGDILTARNGVTIEVQNTDAEGRLILNDALSFAVDEGAARLIDLATLTGACVVALGEEVTGAFTNNQEWCERVLAGARTAGEDLWQLPMFDHFADLLKSDVADCRNIGGRWGGAISAAKFLEKFVSGKPWVHLDIAGPAFASSNKPNREGGATGCMVRTLIETAASLEAC